MKYVSIGNGLYARTREAPRENLLEAYRAKQARCAHAKRDPRGMCYECGHIAPREGGTAEGSVPRGGTA